MAGRAIVPCSLELLGQLLFQGRARIAGIRDDPTNFDVVLLMIESDELPPVPEGQDIPVAGAILESSKAGPRLVRFSLPTEDVE